MFCYCNLYVFQFGKRHCQKDVFTRGMYVQKVHDLLLSDFGFERIQLPGDGDCLFHGLSTILNLSNNEQS